MSLILTGILSLIQYKNDFMGCYSEELRPERCEHCGKLKLWHHGIYLRKTAGRRNQSDASLNPIEIQRYYCSSCRKTMSVLPECIPPRRWYLWSIQQVILLLIVSGSSIYKTAKTSQPSRHTISRWISQFKANFWVHRDTLIGFNESLYLHTKFDSFWITCLGLMSLSEAMRLCHVSGVIVP